MTKKTDYIEWLAKLKIRDKVIIKHMNFASHGKKFYSVDKIRSITEGTPYNLITTVTFPYEFEMSIAVHDKWDSQIHILMPVTPEILDDIEKLELESWFDQLDKTDLTLDQLRRMKATIEGKMFNKNTYNPMCPDYDGYVGQCKRGIACRKEVCDREEGA